jgi:hypothetical protein
MRRGILCAAGLAVTACLTFAGVAVTASSAFAQRKMTVTLSSPKAGQPGYPTCTAPSTNPGHVTNHCSLGVKLMGAPGDTPVSVSECATTFNATNCSRTVGSKAGDVVQGTTNGNGTFKDADYTILASHEKDLPGSVGGNCRTSDYCTIEVYVAATDQTVVSLPFNPT